MKAAHEEKYHAGTLLASSEGRRWRNLSAQIWHHSSGIVVSKALQKETEIAIETVGHPEVVVTRRSGKTSEETRSVLGTIWMCPSGVVEDLIHLSAPTSRHLHVFLSAALFSPDFLGDRVPPDSGNAIRYETGFRDPLIAQIGEVILRELYSETSVGPLLIDACAAALAARLMQRHFDIPSGRRDATKEGGLDERRLRRVLDFIDAHLEDDFDIGSLAQVACLSRFHFTRAFKVSLGRTPQKYVSALRLSRAEILVSDSGRSFTDIGLALGFSSEASFSKAFKRSTGVSPRRFRAQKQKDG